MSTQDRPGGELPDREVDERFADLARSIGPLDVPLTGPRDYVAAEDEEGFVEPEPELGPGNPAVVLGWFALIGGIVLAIAVFALDWSGAVGMLGALLAAGGLAALLLQLPKGPRDPDDDGAQV